MSWNLDMCMRADRQTCRHADCNTFHPYRRRGKIPKVKMNGIPTALTNLQIWVETSSRRTEWHAAGHGWSETWRRICVFEVRRRRPRYRRRPPLNLRLPSVALSASQTGHRSPQRNKYSSDSDSYYAAASELKWTSSEHVQNSNLPV